MPKKRKRTYESSGLGERSIHTQRLKYIMFQPIGTIGITNCLEIAVPQATEASARLHREKMEVEADI